jgi:hypothetical protein
MMANRLAGVGGKESLREKALARRREREKEKGTGTKAGEGGEVRMPNSEFN